MKKISLSLILVLAGIFLFSPLSEAIEPMYMIPDNVDVQVDIFVNCWEDCIGGADSAYEVYGINYSQTGNELDFNLYTNFPSTGHAMGSPGQSAGIWYTKPGDLMIDVDGDYNYEYALALVGHDDTSEYDGNIAQGQLYSISDLYAPAYYRPYVPPDVISRVYGSYWKFVGSDSSTKRPTYVRANGTDILDTVDVSWIGGGDNPNYSIDFTLDLTAFLDMGFDNEIGIYWTAATCANDVIVGNVPVTVIPEPGTWLLLGSGLLGLVAFGRRKKREER